MVQMKIDSLPLTLNLKSLALYEELERLISQSTLPEGRTGKNIDRISITTQIMIQNFPQLPKLFQSSISLSLVILRVISLRKAMGDI